MSKNISDNARVYGNAWVYGNARISDNARISGDARIYGNAWVYSNAWVYGNADISSNNDWFSFTYEGQTITGYRSRNNDGYELNINGRSVDRADIPSVNVVNLINELIGKFDKLEINNIPR